MRLRGYINFGWRLLSNASAFFVAFISIFCVSPVSAGVNDIPFNNEEERQIALDSCEAAPDYTEMEIRLLGHSRYAKRQLATSALIQQRRIRVGDREDYCRLAQEQRALHRAMQWAANQQLSDEFGPLEAIRRLQQISRSRWEQFESDNFMTLSKGMTTDRIGSIMLGAAIRATPEQAALKTVQEWDARGCDPIQVQCHESFSADDPMAVYLGVESLWRCSIVSNECLIPFRPNRWEVPLIGLDGQIIYPPDPRNPIQCPFGYTRQVEWQPGANENTDRPIAEYCKRKAPLDVAPQDPRPEGFDPKSDSDGDRISDESDLCPFDIDKNEPLTNGCNEPETCEDSDGDGTPDCSDECWLDPEKAAPGSNGCGVSDKDSDSDGTMDVFDLCPSDATKLEPGLCGCGVADDDFDGDGSPNCHDECLADPLKLTPGACGCGTADTDADEDGAADFCGDGCPSDSAKTAPGVCGCGLSDADTDSDGNANCEDECPDDAAKISPGICGCGMSDSDSDSDGAPDLCADECPADPAKISAGVCGCGISDIDSDNDGSADLCTDECPSDPLKQEAGTCGCGVQETDSDGDGTADCRDICPRDSGVATDVASRCSCLCKAADGSDILSALSNKLWVLSGIMDEAGCAATNGRVCRSSDAAEGHFERCELGFVEISA